MKDFLGYIYMTTNIINGKIYIGQHIGEEWHYDTKYLGTGKPYFKDALKKHGKDNFYNQLICYADNQESLNNLEIFFIDYYKSTNPEIGYNISKGGHSGSDVINWIKENEPERYKEICNKMSKTRKYNISLPEYVHPMQNKHQSEESKQKSRITWVNKDEEIKKEIGEKISKTKRYQTSLPSYKNPMQGKHHTEESIERQKVTILNKDEEIKKEIGEKISKIKKYQASLPSYINPFKGKTHTDDAKEKNRQKHLGKINSKYTKKLCSLKRSLYWAIKRNISLEIIENIKEEIRMHKLTKDIK